MGKVPIPMHKFHNYPMVSLPVVVPTSKKKNFLINLNSYRNAHYRTLTKAKYVFREIIQSQIDSLPVFEKVGLWYTLYPRTRHKQDVGNICSIADKFFCDALQDNEKIPEDNYDHIPEVAFNFGHIDKENPRVTVHIIPLL